MERDDIADPCLHGATEEHSVASPAVPGNATRQILVKVRDSRSSRCKNVAGEQKKPASLSQPRIV